MVLLKRVENRNRVYEDAHQEKLKTILKFFASDPSNWRDEWSVNPLYMADLGHYGAGSCMCGHAIRYQFQFINNVNHRTLPVGSVCVRQLDLPKYSEVLEKLERLLQLADPSIDPTLDAMEFVKKYKKIFSIDNIKTLIDYNKLTADIDFNYYREFYRKRKYSTYTAERIKEYLLKVHDIATKFVKSIENKSTPVTPNQVASLDHEFEEKAKQFANAKQLSLF